MLERVPAFLCELGEGWLYNFAFEGRKGVGNPKIRHGHEISFVLDSTPEK